MTMNLWILGLQAGIMFTHLANPKEHAMSGRTDGDQAQSPARSRRSSSPSRPRTLRASTTRSSCRLGMSSILPVSTWIRRATCLLTSRLRWGARVSRGHRAGSGRGWRGPRKRFGGICIVSFHSDWVLDEMAHFTSGTLKGHRMILQHQNNPRTNCEKQQPTHRPSSHGAAGLIVVV